MPLSFKDRSDEDLLLELRRLNAEIEQLNLAERYEETEPLEHQAAAIIRERSERTLAPIRDRLAKVVQEARRLLGEDYEL